MVLRITASDSGIEYHPLPADDPTRRKPDITRAVERLGWTPRVPLEEGIRRTVEWFRGRPDELGRAAAALTGGQLDGAVISTPR
jgi:dTDP-glucose 4,6-dehydratase